jgi:chromosome segregation ATPase
MPLLYTHVSFLATKNIDCIKIVMIQFMRGEIMNDINLEALVDLQKQLKQLEDKKKSVAKDKYDALKAEYDKNSKRLTAIEKDWRNLSEELQQANEKLTHKKQSAQHKKEIEELRWCIAESEAFNLEHKKTIAKLEKSLKEEKAAHNQTASKLEDSQNKKSGGRKRKSSLPDTDIVAMKKSGKSLRTISKETRLSVNTIQNILKSFS